MVIAQKFTAIVGLAALLFAGFAAPALAWNRGDDIDVRNRNTAVVINETEASASTGGNYAGGSYGGNGGNGGDIENDGDDQDVDDSDTGRGGNGGNSGDWGGTVLTGNASASAGTANVVNSNDTRVNRCGCDDDDNGDVRVSSRNRAFLLNETDADARTGGNAAAGSHGGDAGNGGDIENDDGDDQDVDDSSTGVGGNGGQGGFGGEITTGNARSEAGTLNVTNRNVTRIRR